MFIPRTTLRSLLAFALAVPSTLFSFTLSTDFSKDAPDAVPQGVVVSGTSTGSVIKVVDASTAPEDPFGVEGNKSLLFEKNEEGISIIPKAQWEDLPNLTTGKLTFTVLSLKEAAGIFTSPVLVANLSENGKNGVMAGVAGDNLLIRDGKSNIYIKGVWLPNEPNVIELSFSVPDQTFMLKVNGVEVKDEGGKAEFAFNAKITGGFNQLGFSVADFSNRSTRAFLDKFELTDETRP